MTKQIYDQDDGSHVMYQYDVANAFSWTRIESDFDSSWQSVRQIYDGDGGAHTVYTYDPQTHELATVLMYTTDWTLIV